MFSNNDLKRLIVPLVIEQVLMSLMGAIDTVMVSNVSPSAISAVSLVDSINLLIVNLLAALAAGGTVVCAQYLGKGDMKQVKNSSNQLLLSVLAFSIVITIIFYLSHRQLLSLIFGSVEADVMANSIKYFTITMLSYPFVALNSASSALFRAIGNSRLPMTIALASNGLNIIGNAILIFGLGMGVAGAAIPTLVSRIVAALIILYFQHKPNQPITLDNIISIRPDVPVIRTILRIGIPSGLENSSFHFGKLLVQSAVSTLGTVAISVQALTNNLEFLSSMASIGIGLALVTVVGQCMGAGKPEEARIYSVKLIKMSTMALFISLVLVLLLTRPVTMIAGMDPMRADMTFDLVLKISIFKFLFWPFSFTPAYGMRAAGDVKYTTLVSVISMWLLRVSLTYILILYAGMGLMGAWIPMFADWFTRSLFYFIRFRSGKWLEKKVID
jgi:putative MATE family efflux protein